MTKIDDLPSEGEGLEEIVRGVRTIDDRLDEVARARIGANVAMRLGRDLDARAIARARHQARALRLPMVAIRWLLPAAGAALAAWLAVAHHLDRRPEVSSAPAPVGTFDRMEVPAGARVRTRLGRADLTVVGPAEMEVTRVATSEVTLRLASGILVGDYDGRGGGRLRIETPRLIATIVGTRFVVEATAVHARVSVVHGRVAVRDAATPEGEPETFVTAGQSWEVGRSGTVATPEAVAHLLTGNASARGDLEDEAVPGEAPTGNPPATAVAAGAGGLRRSAPPARRTEPEPTRAVVTSEPPARRTEAEPTGALVTPEPQPSLQPPPVVVPTKQPAPAASPAELYRRAEEAMSRRDDPDARRWLEEIVTRYPRESEAESARFELARAALADHQPMRASRWIDELIAEGRDRSLVESARFLKCRLAREGGEASEARACLERFRSAHPGSARDEEALAALIRLAEERNACDERRLLVSEHRRLYPGIVLPESNHARCAP